jgi:uncharacterized protein (DUF983 family)
MEIPIPQKKPSILRRGIKGLCPSCGQSKLFKSYLKQNDLCSACGENLSTIHADDGPAWLTVFLAGPFFLPIILYFTTHDVLPEWIMMALLVIAIPLFVLLLLPRVKGLLIAVIWLISKKSSS